MASAEEELTVSGASLGDNKAWDNINILSSGVYTFDKGPRRTVTVQGLPPAPVVWTYNTVDLVCDVVGCENWRSYLNLEDDSWWSEKYRVPPVQQLFPKLPSFTDFRSQPQSSSTATSTVDALYRYAFHTPSTALGDLTTPTALGVLLVLCWVWHKIKAVVSPAASATGRRLARRTHGDAWVSAKDNQVRIAKFGEYVVRLFYHSAISVYGLVYFFYANGGTSEWWQAGHTKAVFAGYPHHEILPGIAWYYLLQAAYNLDAFWALLELSFVIRIRSPVRVGGMNQEPACSKGYPQKQQKWQSPIAIEWSPTVRGDFKEMMVHHVVTNLLIFGSSLYRLTRVGSSKSCHRLSVRSFAIAVVFWLACSLTTTTTNCSTTHVFPLCSSCQWSFWCTIFPMSPSI